jgi:hypothetical protein
MPLVLKLKYLLGQIYTHVPDSSIYGLMQLMQLLMEVQLLQPSGHGWQDPDTLL